MAGNDYKIAKLHLAPEKSCSVSVGIATHPELIPRSNRPVEIEGTKTLFENVWLVYGKVYETRMFLSFADRLARLTRGCKNPRIRTA